MDLHCIKQYFEVSLQAEMQLQGHWDRFNKIPAYSLFRCIATRQQSALDYRSIRAFIESFNWKVDFPEQHALQERANYSIHSLVNDNSSNLLEKGIKLLIDVWGKQQLIVFDSFSLFVKGGYEIPVEGEIGFQVKKELYQCFIDEIRNLGKLQQIKKVVFHEYINLSDLFQSLTSTHHLESQNINRLFLSFSHKLSQQQLMTISKRCKLPWDYQTFVNIFKNCLKTKSEYKIYHSARRVKDGDNGKDFSFSTPRKQKQSISYLQSTKLTRKYENASINTTPFTIKEEKYQQVDDRDKKQQFIQILGTLLEIEQKFNMRCSSLIKKLDFDLELVYQIHGGKFQEILNQRFGLCNFSAFLRFIVPKDYQHRYLAFIRYQTDDQISIQTQRSIDELIQCYYRKQQEIKELWKRCDKEVFLRNFCLPKEEAIRSEKLGEFFTKREANLLLQRLDPHQLGEISLQALN